MHQPKLLVLVNSMSSDLNVKANVHEAVVRKCGAGVNHVEASNFTCLCWQQSWNQEMRIFGG